MAKNLNEIFSIDNGQTAIEILDSAFEIEKVMLNFIKRGADGIHPEYKILIYMDTSEFLNLADNIKNGNLMKLNEQLKSQFIANGSKGFPKATYELLGGTAKEKLKVVRPDGLSESRVLKLLPATRSKTSTILLQAECGGGMVQGTGIIVPKMNYKATNPLEFRRIQVGTDYKTLKKMCLMVESRYNAYLAGQYVKGAYDWKKQN